MKRPFFILMVFIASVLSTSVMAQAEKQKDVPKKEGDGTKKDKGNHIDWFKKFRRDFLTEKVQMSPKEADAFFPLYDELSDKKFKLHWEVAEKMKKVWDENKATEEDYNAVLDAKEDALMKEAALEKEYNQKFRKILSAKKMFRLKMAEDEFSRGLMKRPERGDKDKKDSAPDRERHPRPDRAPVQGGGNN